MKKLQLVEDKPSQIVIAVNGRAEIDIQDFWCPIHFPFHAPWNECTSAWVKLDQTLTHMHLYIHSITYPRIHASVHLPTHPPIHPSIHPSLNSFSKLLWGMFWNEEMYIKLLSTALSQPLCDREQVPLTIWASGFSLENKRNGLD